MISPEDEKRIKKSVIEKLMQAMDSMQFNAVEEPSSEESIVDPSSSPIEMDIMSAMKPEGEGKEEAMESPAEEMEEKSEPEEMEEETSEEEGDFANQDEKFLNMLKSKKPKK